MFTVDALGSFLSISTAGVGTPHKLPSNSKEWLHCCFPKHAKIQGGKDICKACSQNPFPCKFTSRVLSICFARMSDNKLQFHLLCWKTEQQTVPGLIPPPAQIQQPWHTPVNFPFFGNLQSDLWDPRDTGCSQPQVINVLIIHLSRNIKTSACRKRETNVQKKKEKKKKRQQGKVK